MRKKTLSRTRVVEASTAALSGASRDGTIIRAWLVDDTARAYLVRCYGRRVAVPKSQTKWMAVNRLWISALHLDRSPALRDLIQRGALVRQHMIDCR
jgi:hypothetical protein